jgi:hypothetical protein
MATLSQRKKQPERGAGCGVSAMSPSTTPKKMASAFDIAGSGPDQVMLDKKHKKHTTPVYVAFENHQWFTC